MSDHDDTPPERDVLGYLVRLSAELGELRVYAERHQTHIAHLRSDVCEFRDEVRTMVPRVEDHTGRLKRLEASSRVVGGQLTLWKGMGLGLGLALTLAGGLVAALAAAGVIR